jgi:hypothetical protein
VWQSVLPNKVQSNVVADQRTRCPEDGRRRVLPVMREHVGTDWLTFRRILQRFR